MRGGGGENKHSDTCLSYSSQVDVYSEPHSQFLQLTPYNLHSKTSEKNLKSEIRHK